MSPYLKKIATANAKRYAKSKGLTIEENSSFGYGQDGYVFQTNRRTAVKAFYYDVHYRQELEIYKYLDLWDIREAANFHIPELVSNHDQLRIIEMSVVSTPFILDFVGATIDRPFDRDEDWLATTIERFGADWDIVKLAIMELEEHGVYLSDIHPGNIRCRS